MFSLSSLRKNDRPGVSHHRAQEVYKNMEDGGNAEIQKGTMAFQCGNKEPLEALQRVLEVLNNTGMEACIYYPNEYASIRVKWDVDEGSDYMDLPLIGEIYYAIHGFYPQF